MSVKIISNNKKRITLEVTIDLNNKNFLQTEELIMDKVNELGRTITEEALKKLDIKERVIILPQKSRQFKKKSNSIQNSLSHALILTKST